MSELVDELFEETVELIQRYGKCLLKDTNCDIEQEWNGLSPVMMYLCDEAKKQAVTQKIFRDFIDEIEESCEPDVDISLVDKYKITLDKGLQSLKLGESNNVYREFKNLMLSKVSKKLDESDITTISENVNLLDPITKLRLTDPVKNVMCGHVYERTTILQLILSKKNIKCPIPGCLVSNVKEKDLVSDTVLKRFLERNQNT